MRILKFAPFMLAIVVSLVGGVQAEWNKVSPDVANLSLSTAAIDSDTTVGGQAVACLTSGTTGASLFTPRPQTPWQRVHWGAKIDGTKLALLGTMTVTSAAS
jgi:hypothetical protein